MGPLAVVAIGGNALTRAGEPGEASQISAHAAEMAQCVAALRAGRRVVVVHGNGPQVGNLALQQEGVAETVPAQPLPVLGAMTQGQLGSVLVGELDRCCGPGAAVAVVTHVRVDPDDPAFLDPVKPVGPFFSRERAVELAGERGWTVGEDSGRGYRRLVASPRPVEIVELPAIRTLVEAGYLVVAAGGGGVPVSAQDDGGWQGVDGVIDKDHAAAALARALGADELYLLTGVDTVFLDFGTPAQRAAYELDVDEARGHLRDGQFAAGSMAPKIEAALAFLDSGGRRAVVTSAERLADVAAGARGAGTTIVASRSAPARATCQTSNGRTTAATLTRAAVRVEPLTTRADARIRPDRDAS